MTFVSWNTMPPYDHTITWKWFLQQPFVRGIHWSPSNKVYFTNDSPHKEPLIWSWCFQCCWPEEIIQQTFELPVIWAGHVMSLMEISASSHTVSPVVVLLWHVQKFHVIWSARNEIWGNEISIEFELWWKNRSQNETPNEMCYQWIEKNEILSANDRSMWYLTN